MTISELCVRRPVFALMLISFLVVLGVFSFRDLGVDLFPRSDPATVNISIQLPGATPEEMATQVVLPIEEAVNTISGLDELSAQLSEGSAGPPAHSFSNEISSAPPKTSVRKFPGLYDIFRPTFTRPSSR